MIAAHLAVLREQRRTLLAQAAEEREALAAVLSRTDAAGAWLDAGIALADRARRHPALLIGAGVTLLALRPKLSMKWLLRVWSLWRVVRSIRAAL